MTKQQKSSNCFKKLKITGDSYAISLVLFFSYLSHFDLVDSSDLFCQAVFRSRFLVEIQFISHSRSNPMGMGPSPLFSSKATRIQLSDFLFNGCISPKLISTYLISNDNILQIINYIYSMTPKTWTKFKYIIYF